MNERNEREGYLAGLNKAGLPSYDLTCPYDGRTREGRAWWKGFMEGDRLRCAQARRAKKGGAS